MVYNIYYILVILVILPFPTTSCQNHNLKKDDFSFLTDAPLEILYAIDGF